MFVLTLNGKLDEDDKPKLQLDKNLELLKACEEYFGAAFWNHLAVVITHWDNDKKSRKKRELKGITDESIQNKVTQFLNENFPASQNKAIKICFTEITEIDDENSDVTSENLK